MCAFWVASSIAAEVDQAVLDAEAERIAVIQKAKDAALAIFSSTGAGGGSGVVISPDGYALSNFHVAKPCGNAMKCGMPDGRLYDAVVVGLDPTGDVALLKLFGRDDFPHAEMGDSDQVQAGDWVFAMGNPFLLATEFQPTVTYGIVSGVHRYQYPSGTLLEYADCLQTDASINPGNSGGPLFDAEGRLIGINGRASFEKRGRVNVGVAYAISINQIKNFLGYLKSGRIVDHATLGATVALDVDGRVVVSNILEESDAYRRGLRYDDEIVAFGGRPVLTPNGFKNVLGIYPKGWRVPLSFRRDAQRRDVLVRLAGLHTEGELLEKTRGRRPARPKPTPQPGDDPESEEPKPEGEEPGDGPKSKEPKPEDRPIPIRLPVPRPGHPHPMPGRPSEEPMPEIVKEHFEAKRGYANYYFNKLSRDRVLNAWSALGDLASVDGAWTLSGPLDGGGRFHFEITGIDAVLTLPSFEHRWIADDSLGRSLVPPGSGGLLPALYLWRRLAVEGPGNFGEVYYLGTVPLAGHEEPVDVLIGIHGGVECRFLFDAGEGHLLAMEMFPEEDVDPCEVYFSDYRQVEGRRLPGRMEVRFGDDPYGVFQLEEVRF
ncbi:MAG: trypsin-like peptidase domain-containing protein, partial [Planctomycetota bacterium]